MLITGLLKTAFSRILMRLWWLQDDGRNACQLTAVRFIAPGRTVVPAVTALAVRQTDHVVDSRVIDGAGRANHRHAEGLRRVRDVRQSVIAREVSWVT